MPDKLYTIEEAAVVLGVSEDRIKKLVENGNLPAYKIGGRFLRFRKEQVEAVRYEIHAKFGTKVVERASRDYLQKTRGVIYPQSFLDRILDFFYFNDFYIVAAALACLILLFIFKT